MHTSRFPRAPHDGANVVHRVLTYTSVREGNGISQGCRDETGGRRGEGKRGGRPSAGRRETLGRGRMIAGARGRVTVTTGAWHDGQRGQASERVYGHAPCLFGKVSPVSTSCPSSSPRSLV